MLPGKLAVRFLQGTIRRGQGCIFAWHVRGKGVLKDIRGGHNAILRSHNILCKIHFDKDTYGTKKR